MNSPLTSPLTKARPSLFLRIGLITLLVLAAATRFWIISSHFTHVDDVGVAGTILSASDPVRVNSLFKEKIQIAASEAGSSRGRLLKSLTSNRAWQAAAPIVASLYRFVCIPAEWTYAPAQFVLTALLVHPSQPYRTALIAGRLPSLLAGVAGIALTVLAFRWCMGRRRPFSAPALVAGSLVACSLEHLLFSAHMSNYALGVAASAALVILLARSFLSAVRPYRRALIHGLALVGLFLCQYQILPLAVAYMTTRFFWELRIGRIGWWRSVIAGGITGTLFALVFVPIFIFRLSDTVTAHWNAGPSGEFAFSPPGTGLSGLLFYTISFFARNGALSFGSLVSFVPESSPAFAPAIAILLILALVGLVALIRSPDRTERYFALFLALTALLWAVMIVSGKMTLAPTRHNLVLLPLVALLIARGVAAIARRHVTAVSSGACLLPCIAMLLCLPGFMSHRRDSISEPHLLELVRQHHVQVIVHADTSHNLILMPSLRGLPTMAITEAARDPGLANRTLLLVSRANPFRPDSSGWYKHRTLEAAQALAKGRVVELNESSINDAEFEFSLRTRNGSNCIHLMVLGPKASESLPDRPNGLGEIH
jgi:hypothetical protein